MPTIKIQKRFPKHLYEKEAWENGNLVMGLDEVGRSCLAGPLVTAAVILNPGVKHKFLKDSKVLTPEERLIAYKWLIKNSKYSVGIVHHRIIDKFNIYNATLIAMKRAINQLIANTKIIPEYILIDAMPVKLEHDIKVLYFYEGETLSKSVAAASIIAKVTRDLLMARLEKSLPNYAFAQNKGYGTKVHREALNVHMPTVIHRKSFLKNFSRKLEEQELSDLIPAIPDQVIQELS